MPDQAAPEQPRVLYLEPDDEITSVVRRLGEVGDGAVILVAPGRSKATSSAIGLRLIARRAAEAGLGLSLVADPASRMLAGEAGIPAFAAVPEALSGRPPAELEPPPRPRAAIHVVRGERSAPLAALAAPSAPSQAAAPPATPRPAVTRAEDTQAVPVVAPPPRPGRAWHIRGPRDARGWAWMAAALVVLAAIVAAILPGATIRIVPQTRTVGPFAYTIALDSSLDSGTVTSTKQADATGTYDASTPAKGTVTFANYSANRVTVPKGTSVSAGKLVFTTDAAVAVPGAPGLGSASTAHVAVTARETGPDGNVAIDAIDTIDDAQLRSDLCAQFFFCTRPLVANRQPLSGGESKTGTEISQADVDGLVAAIKDDLQRQLAQRLAGHPERIYASAAGEDPAITVPQGLVGTRDQGTFELTGSLRYARRYVARDALSEAVTARLQADERARPAGTTLVDGSIGMSQPKLTATGSQLSADVTVTASVAPVLDESELKARIAGRSRDDAIRALADIGPATVELWPGWVDAVPRLPFRIQVNVETPSPQPSASPASAVSPS